MTLNIPAQTLVLTPGFEDEDCGHLRGRVTIADTEVTLELIEVDPDGNAANPAFQDQIDELPEKPSRVTIEGREYVPCFA